LAHARFTLGPFDISLPQWQAVDGSALGLSAIATIMLIWREWDILWVLPTLALVSVAVSLL